MINELILITTIASFTIGLTMLILLVKLMIERYIASSNNELLSEIDKTISEDTSINMLDQYEDVIASFADEKINNWKAYFIAGRIYELKKRLK